MRATSDLNLLIILRRFEQSRVDVFREPLRLAHVSARLSAMFVMDSELSAAAEAFAVKFDDIERRYRILYGEDLVSSLSISRDAKIRRLRQVLLNLSIRLRERYVMVSLREEQLATVVADIAGPLRVAAATILELEGRTVGSPKDALASLSTAMGDDKWVPTLELISAARESCLLPAGKAVPVMFELMAMTKAMSERVEGLA